MNSINRSQLLEQLNWRYAAKQFDPNRKINAQDWATLRRRFATHALQRWFAADWKLIIVTDPAVREKLR